MTNKERMEMMNLRKRVQAQREEIKRLQEVIAKYEKTNHPRNAEKLK